MLIIELSSVKSYDYLAVQGHENFTSCRRLHVSEGGMSAIVTLRSGRSGRSGNITPLMAGDENPQGGALLVMEPIEDDAAGSE